jgi:hypothetical protein
MTSSSRGGEADVVISHPEKASSRAKRGDLTPEKTIINKIATVAALLRNDNFRAPAGAHPAGESYVQLSEIIFFGEENDL